MLRSFKSKIVFTFITVFLITASGVMAGTPCAHLTLGVNPTSVAKGGNVKVIASVQNCSGEPEKFAIHFKAKGPCNYEAGLGTVYMGFLNGATRTASLSFTVPANVCTGTAAITARVYYGGTLIASSTTSLLVQ